jgi:hypothetical protein
MWSRLRETVMGIADQAGIEVPGLDSATSAVTDLAGTAGDALSTAAAEVGGSDLAGTVGDLAGSVEPGEVITGATDAAAGATEVVGGVVDEAAATASGLLDAIKGRLAP